MHKITEIEVTNNCNLNCAFCARGRVKNTGFMTLTVFKNIVKKLSGENCYGVYICGLGEPFLHPKLNEMIGYIKSFGMWAGLSTNGNIIQQKNIEHFSARGLDRIDFNLPSLNKKTYEQICPGSNHKKVISVIHNILKNTKITVYINFVVTLFNQHELKENLVYWMEKGAIFNTIPYCSRGQDAETSSVPLDPDKKILKKAKTRFLKSLCCCSYLFTNYSFIGWDGYQYSCPSDIEKTKKICFFLRTRKEKLEKKRSLSKFWRSSYCIKCRASLAIP